MYSLKYEVILENDQGEILKYFKDKKTAKGVSRAVIDKQLKHDTYIFPKDFAFCELYKG
jgi:hypothetical protein